VNAMPTGERKADGRDWPIAFQSKCPKCAQMRPQRGYNRGSLLRLLNGGHPVEGYCTVCDEFWPISAEERARLATVALLSAA
jgi:hypothetical protein